MFNVDEFKNTPTWDLPQVFYRYCDWCFAQGEDDNGNNCDECQKIFFTNLALRKEKEHA